jgi:hypothetical protein
METHLVGDLHGVVVGSEADVGLLLSIGAVETPVSPGKTTAGGRLTE